MRGEKGEGREARGGRERREGRGREGSLKRPL